MKEIKIKQNNYYEDIEVLEYMKKHCKKRSEWIRKATHNMMVRELKRK